MAEGVIDKTIPGVQSDGDAPSKGVRTRERIMDIAEEAILHKGFAATSIDELVEAAGITKSGFFYHFHDKNDLARQIVARFSERDNRILDQLTERARSLSDDPLQSFLIFIRLFAETMDDLPELHPGCLAASITYQERFFDREVTRLIRETAIGWRTRFHDWLSEIAELYPPAIPADLTALADHFTVVADGGIITSRALGDKAIIGRQMRLLHDHVKLLFGGR
ncbi:TetR/AcrR family transcriptional regulator [Sphingomonas crocodyli]|uniref:TetR/AcrR family transcriptional regulator n=1 Tax=Sphingomonas crocodyli TaxID=1979270 RepID=A0A437MAA2_9SPHN|nr:TetR/AcrR family transcriptional regulator [Sphingomonas crocodyli]RVT94561.1 TetR/AcrR family transcriptional regulator [Sphingomonas crocodyli]